MRWVGGQIQPVGGWTAVNYILTGSRIKRIHVWIANNGQKYIAYLCEIKCYVDKGDGVLQDITPVGGLAPPSLFGAGGYGDDLYSLDDYGTPRPDQNIIRPVTPAYSLDNWGENLLAMTSADGRLLEWKPSTPTTPLVAVTGAPVANRCFVITPERYVIVFGKDGIFNKFGWCDQENLNNWTPGITSKAGNYTIQPAAPIVCACKAGGETVMFTTTTPYVIRYVGLPYIYAYTELGAGATPVSPQSISAVPDGAIWFSESGPWRYNGTSAFPIFCDIWEWIIDDYSSVGARYDSFAVNVAAPAEVWWFFPTTDQQFNNRYAMFNYREEWWSMGRLERSAGFSASYSDLPIMADDQIVYQHEAGEIYGDSLPWAETFTMNLSSGDRFGTLDQMIPDIEGDTTNLGFSFFLSDTRVNNFAHSGVDSERQSIVRMMRSDGYLDIRETARDFRMKIEALANPVKRFTIGQSLVEFKVRGKAVHQR